MRDSCSYSVDRFFLISVETDMQLRGKEQTCCCLLTGSKGYSDDDDLIKITEIGR